MGAEGREAFNFALWILVHCLLVSLVEGPLDDGPTVSWYVADVRALDLGSDQGHSTLHHTPIVTWGYTNHSGSGAAPLAALNKVSHSLQQKGDSMTLGTHRMSLNPSMHTKLNGQA